MNVKWKVETARDILALGSWVFFALVVIRAAILPNKTFLYEMIISGAVLIILEMIFRKYDSRVAKALAIAVFTSLYYKVMLYSIFVGAVYLLMIGCSRYSGRRWRDIIVGILFGIIAIALGYYLAMMI